MKTAFIGISILGILSLFYSCNTDDYISEESVEQASKHINSVTKAEAMHAAISFWEEENKGSRSSEKKMNIDNISVLKHQGKPSIYVINKAEGGFVMISASKDYNPIVGYSETGNFNASSTNEALQQWIRNMSQDILESEVEDTVKFINQLQWQKLLEDKTAKKTSYKKSAYTPSQAEIACWNRCDELCNQYSSDGWMVAPLTQAEQTFNDAGYSTQYNNLLYSSNFNHSLPNTSVIVWKLENVNDTIGPLLKTAWHQEAPYNNWCEGKLAGCAAIALSQVMYYYKHPQIMEYNGYVFNWDNIEERGTDYNNNAALIRFVGEAINTHYWDSGSWTTTSSFVSGIELLGYSVNESSYRPDIVEHSIAGHRPIIFLGNENDLEILPGDLSYIGTSHYWVCDGFRRQKINCLSYFTEWQPNGNGNFIQGLGSPEQPEVLAGLVNIYYHMNWGNGSHNSLWLLHTGSGHTFNYSRKIFDIRKLY